MAFNPNSGAYQVTSTSSKYMPVVMLLDVSGSMSGAKIDNLYDATIKMIETFAQQEKREHPYKIAIITFGARVELHTPYTDAKTLTGLSRFSAGGGTPLGTALRMAKDMIEDKDTTSLKWLRPAVVLVSDGWPDGGWQQQFNDFIGNGRTARCQRMSMGIGDDADYNMLETFASDDETGVSGMAKFCFKASDASDIADKMQRIGASIQGTVGQNPKFVPTGESKTGGSAQVSVKPKKPKYL